VYRKKYHNNNANGSDFWIWLLIAIGVICVPYIAIPIIIVWFIFSK